MECFIIWEVIGNILRIVELNKVSLFITFESAARTKARLEKENPEHKYFIRLFREPEIINALTE